MLPSLLTLILLAAGSLECIAIRTTQSSEGLLLGSGPASGGPLPSISALAAAAQPLASGPDAADPTTISASLHADLAQTEGPRAEGKTWRTPPQYQVTTEFRQRKPSQNATVFFHMAADPADPSVIFISDFKRHVVQRLHRQSGKLTVLAGQVDVDGYRDGASSEALFHDPHGLCVDPTGAVFVVDSGNAAIRRISPTGRVTTAAGIPDLPGHQDGDGRHARFTQGIFDILCLPDGAVLIGDPGSAALRRMVCVSHCDGDAPGPDDPDDADPERWSPAQLLLLYTGLAAGCIAGFAASLNVLMRVAQPSMERPRKRVCGAAAPERRQLEAALQDGWYGSGALLPRPPTYYGLAAQGDATRHGSGARGNADSYLAYLDAQPPVLVRAPAAARSPVPWTATHSALPRRAAEPDHGTDTGGGGGGGGAGGYVVDNGGRAWRAVKIGGREALLAGAGRTLPLVRLPSAMSDGGGNAEQLGPIAAAALAAALSAAVTPHPTLPPGYDAARLPFAARAGGLAAGFGPAGLGRSASVGASYVAAGAVAMPTGWLPGGVVGGRGGGGHVSTWRPSPEVEGFYQEDLTMSGVPERGAGLAES